MIVLVGITMMYLGCLIAGARDLDDKSSLKINNFSNFFIVFIVFLIFLLFFNFFRNDWTEC